MKIFKINNNEYPFVFGVSSLQYFYDNPQEYTLVNIAKKGLEQGYRRTGQEMPKDIDVEALLDDDEKFFTEVSGVEGKHTASILVKKTFLQEMQRARTEKQKEKEEED